MYFYKYNEALKGSFTLQSLLHLWSFRNFKHLSRPSETGTTNPQYQPLKVFWCPSCGHAQKTIDIPLTPIHSFIKQPLYAYYVKNHWPEARWDCFHQFFIAMQLMNCFPPSKTFLCVRHFSCLFWLLVKRGFTEFRPEFRIAFFSSQIIYWCGSRIERNK